MGGQGWVILSRHQGADLILAPEIKLPMQETIQHLAVPRPQGPEAEGLERPTSHLIAQGPRDANRSRVPAQEVNVFPAAKYKCPPCLPREGLAKNESAGPAGRPCLKIKDSPQLGSPAGAAGTNQASAFSLPP